VVVAVVLTQHQVQDLVEPVVVEMVDRVLMVEQEL
jgi:hypothetical protein|tara:strand:+ start:445 stop:549 length:105 start_codon:yes stop_codon:yes gene_type:complete